MLSINVLRLEVKMQLVVLFILRHDLGPLHIETYWKNSAQREVWVFDVLSVHFFILVQKIWVLELFNRLMSNLRHPVVDSQSSVLQNHLLKIIKLKALVVIRFKIFD